MVETVSNAENTKLGVANTVEPIHVLRRADIHRAVQLRLHKSIGLIRIGDALYYTKF